MLTLPQNLFENLRSVRGRIAAAAQSCGRSVDSVTLVAVGKGQPVELLDEAARLGVLHFGESYLQEALPKIAALAGRDLVWHFIGRLQANKTRAIASEFAWVHTLDRLKLAERLSTQRPHYSAPLNVCVQIRIGSEASKGGITPAEAADLIAAARELPRLRLRGLMCLPPYENDVKRQRANFEQLRELLDALNLAGAGLDTLSMGMSGDFESAIRAGSTHVRIGEALFGPRS
jgi:pyridoxal phosphate enzyme (YggS family)